MLKLSQFLAMMVIGFNIQAQQQLIAHWTPYQINDSIFGQDVTDYTILDSSNANDIFQVNYAEGESLKAELTGIITKKEFYDRSLNHKIYSTQLEIIENIQVEIEGYTIQLKLLKNGSDEELYATCFYLSYDIPEVFELYSLWNSDDAILKKQILYYEILSSDQSIIVDIVRLMFRKIEKDAAINWSPSTTSTSTTNLMENEKIELIIYPNPASNFIKFKTTNPKTMNIIIYNHQGKQIIKKFNHNLQNTININQLHEGNYFIQLHDEEQRITKELIVNRYI